MNALSIENMKINYSMKLKIIFVLVLLLFSTNEIFAYELDWLQKMKSINFFSAKVVAPQELEFTVKGRVVGESGKPRSKIAVWVSPVKNSRVEGTLTDENGIFSLTQKHNRGVVWYLYTVDGTTCSKNEWSLIYPTSFDVGRPIKFGDETVIDVGDVKIQEFYVDVNLRIQKNGKNLTEKQWDSLWVRLKDEQGKVPVESSVAPYTSKKVDLEKSILKLSLPEGKWKLELQKFDYDRVKLYPKLIGQTSYFVIDRKKNTEIINIALLNQSRENFKFINFLQKF